MKSYKPTSAGIRHRLIIEKSMLYKGKSISNLTKGFKNKAGRNNSGKITVYHRGGGLKHSYRKIDFRQTLENFEFIHIEYDPNRSAHIALIKTESGELKYILASNELIESNRNIKIGTPLKQLTIGTFIHNLELIPNTQFKLIRSAGVFGTIYSIDSPNITVKLPSGELRKFNENCRATIGIVSNSDHSKTIIGSAGYNRLLGKRPIVRGVAMNPIDHPHGGDTSGGRPSASPWGRLTKGQPTRSKKKANKWIIKRC